MTETIACPSCGAVQAASADPAPGRVITCAVCRSELERSHGRSLDGALALAAATLLLLVPSNLLPFLTTSVLGVSQQSHLGSAAAIMWGDGWPWLAVAITLFVVVFPLVRFGLLTVVLGMLWLGRRSWWLGPAFRYANLLQMWAMPEVFMLGMWVAYSRIAPTIEVSLGRGAICFILASLGSLFTRATLDRAGVWRMIAPEAPLPESSTGKISCDSCDLLLDGDHDGGHCPRCAGKLYARRPNATVRAAALTVAALALYFPANIYPIATLPVGLIPAAYTVIEGVRDLIDANLYGLALLVFTASFLIPFAKIAGLAWCVVSVLRRSKRGLIFKTRLYRVVEEIGRWSMLDPFVISCAVPVLRYNQLIYGRADPGATAFAAVVILTMVAAHCFDPRLIWDAAGKAA